MEINPLVTLLVGGLSAAFVLAVIARRAGLPLMVAYIAAGFIAGPKILAPAAEPELVLELADIGLVVLMFGLGLRYPPPGQHAFRAAAIPGVLIQIALAGLIGFATGSLLELSARHSAILAAVLAFPAACSVLNAIGRSPAIDTGNAALMTSWLKAQTAMAILAALAVVTVPSAVADGGGYAQFGEKAAMLGGFVFVLAVLARRLLARILVLAARLRSREVFALGVYAMGLCIAYSANVLTGIGFAAGALLAGLALGQSALSHRAGDDLIPFRDAYAVLFFVTLGMLLEPQAILDQPIAFCAILGVILIGNAAAIFAGSTIVRLPLQDRIVLMGSFTHIGEFAILIAGTAFALDLFPAAIFSLIVAAAAATIAINPVVRRLVGLAARRYG